MHERERSHPDHLLARARELQYTPLFRWPRLIDKADTTVLALQSSNGTEERRRVVIAGYDYHGCDRRQFLQSVNAARHLGVAGAEAVEDIAGVEDQVRLQRARITDCLLEDSVMIGRSRGAIGHP